VIGDATAVWVPAHVIRVLLRDARLGEYRVRRRGADPDVDAVLIAMRLVDLATTPGQPVAPTVDTSAPSERRLSPRQAADRLGVSPRSIRRWITRGDLPANRDRAGYVLNPDDVDAYAARRSA
jgi:excisionase family DNA binding protein